MEKRHFEINRLFKNGKYEVYKTNYKGLNNWLKSLLSDKERNAILNRLIKEKETATFKNKKGQQYLIKIVG